MTIEFKKTVTASLFAGAAFTVLPATAQAQEIVGDDGAECVVEINDGATTGTANATAEGEDALACGEDANANGPSTTAVGGESNAEGPGATAIGWQADASAERATALGHLATAQGVRSLAIGENADTER